MAVGLISRMKKEFEHIKPHAAQAKAYATCGENKCRLKAALHMTHRINPIASDTRDERGDYRCLLSLVTIHCGE